jgi:carboxyl-terminal processing protease
MRNKKLQVWLPLIFSLVMIAGMFFGFKLNQEDREQGKFFQKGFQNLPPGSIRPDQDRYVDSVRFDSLQDDAITEVMNHLDPHSHVYSCNGCQHCQ